MGETERRWTPSELQLDSPGVIISARSVDVFCALVNDCSTGISANPERKSHEINMKRKTLKIYWLDIKAFAI